MPPVLIDTCLPLSVAAKIYALDCEFCTIVRKLPIESDTVVPVIAAGVVPPIAGGLAR